MIMLDYDFGQITSLFSTKSEQLLAFCEPLSNKFKVWKNLHNKIFAVLFGYFHPTGTIE